MLNIIKNNSIFTVLVIFFTLNTFSYAKDLKWEGFVDVEGKAGSKRHLGEADIFLPITQNENSLLFTTLRYRLDNQSSREGNFGLGIRHILPSNWIIGGYAYYDRRKSPYDNIFRQVTLGVELLSNDWDFRANIYKPFGKKEYLEESLSQVEFTDTSILYSQGEERALKGFDAEIGWRIPIFEEDEDKQLRLYIGGYKFYEKDIETIKGPRGRIDLTFNEVPFLWKDSRLTLGAETQKDDIRGSQSFASLRLRIPFSASNSKSKPKLSALERRMTTPIIRDIDIVSQAGIFEAPQKVTQDANGNSINMISSTNISGADLKSIIENAGENTTIVLSGEFSGVNNITTLKEGQSIIGKGNVEITTPAGQKVSIPTPGASITGKGGYTTLTASNVFFRMSSNTSLIGITAHNTDTSGSGTAIVHMKDANNVTIKDNTLSVTSSQNAAYVITVDSSSNLYIGNNTLHMHNNGTYGSLIGFIQKGSDMRNITFENNIYNATGTANKSRVFYFFDVNISNLNGSNNSTDMAVGSMGTYMHSSTVTGNVSFTNGYTVQ
ncbi:MAG: inverse autotransporter beta domain-containing protein [Halarcobacter ebronensis]|uniref:inverse autotransporter beta domain-containing protein n=1 Tax=Halarcobacter ebronensis TaxID=1462615 RepID=UPI003C7379A8